MLSSDHRKPQSGKIPQSAGLIIDGSLPVVKDAERDEWLADRGIKVLRVWNAQLRREEQLVRDVIWQAFQERAPKSMPEPGRTGVMG